MYVHSSANRTKHEPLDRTLLPRLESAMTKPPQQEEAKPPASANKPGKAPRVKNPSKATPQKPAAPKNAPKANASKATGAEPNPKRQKK